jgi:hypothetical protein
MSEKQLNCNQQQHSPSSLWQQLVLDISQTSTSTPLNQLVCHLDYAVNDDEISPEQALEVMAGERRWLLNIEQDQHRNLALTAFDEVATLKASVAYVTREFVRQDCGINGATFSDEDCDTVIAYVQQLALGGKFKHSGVYWIANALAGDGLIHPQLPERWRRY